MAVYAKGNHVFIEMPFGKSANGKANPKGLKFIIIEKCNERTVSGRYFMDDLA